MPRDPSRALSEEEIAELREQLVRAVAKTCPRWLAADADDLVQGALLKVLEIARRREGTVEFSTFYLRRTAYSTVVDEIRRRRRRREVPLDEGPGMDDQPTLAADPERLSSDSELGRAIRGCLETLIRPRRLAVTLHLQGHKIREVGEFLGWKAKRAENLIYRGLDDLRGCLDRKGFGR